MRRAIGIAVLCLTVLACSSEKAEETTAKAVHPPENEVADAIREHERFSEPILVEIWSNSSGPTTDALETHGLLARNGETGRLELTEEGRSSLGRETFFQSDVPVFYFPVGHRELVEVAPVPGGRLVGVLEIEFTYRNSPNALGSQLIDDGSRVTDLDSAPLRSGRAILGRHEEDWRISNLQL